MSKAVPSKANLVRELSGDRIGLLGTLAALAGSNPHHQHRVEEAYFISAICGTEGITPTSGYGKWKNVERRQRISITVLEGYDPYTITVPLIFDSQADPDSVEKDLDELEWMGGRGQLFNSRPGHAGEGDTPLIQIFSAEGSSLVPSECSNEDIRFVVSGIEYNMAGRELILPIRRADGERIRQAATVTLTQYEGAIGNGGLDSPANRANVARKLKQEYDSFTVADGVNTFRKIAKHFNRNPNRISSAAREIANANAKLGASVDKRLNHGVRVRVPLSATTLHQ